MPQRLVEVFLQVLDVFEPDAQADVVGQYAELFLDLLRNGEVRRARGVEANGLHVAEARLLPDEFPAVEARPRVVVPPATPGSVPQDPEITDEFNCLQATGDFCD